MRLALFDLDNTLLAGDSDFEWAQFLIEKGVVDREVFEARNRQFYEDYKNGTLDIREFLAFQLKPLSRHPRTQLDLWHEEYMENKVRPMMLDAAAKLLKSHENDLCAIVTATNSFVTAPIARAYGISNLIATEPEVVGGEFTGSPCGTPSFREGKVERLNDWLASMGTSLASFESSWFYSDSLNDLPLLSVVTNPVAVDPDPTLRAHAENAGWPVISLRYPL
ncbi:MAG TPA: HAD family hydrolase [Burkholderiales bacterium]|nr:HAD family hydrolase [Burkholderiales bacterium]